MTRKNILMIFADQWRHDQFGAARSYTPNLDALAREAVHFENHYTQAIPCSPARASVFTGLCPQNHGVFANNVPLDTRHRTVAQELRRFGYAPTLFGYTDTRLDPRQFDPGDPRRVAKYQVMPGCEVGCHQPDDAPLEWMAHLRGRGLSFASRDECYAPDTSRPNATGGVAGHPARFAAEDSDTAFLTDRLLDWHSVQEPGWCALLCYLRPHNPTIAPEPWNAHVDPADLQPPVRHDSPDRTAGLHPYLEGQISQGDASRQCPPGLTGRIADVGEKDWRSIRAIHLALMAELDAHVGRVIKRLKDSGQWDDTLVVFSSDHGEMMFDQYMCNQAAWYDQCAHVPLILRLPEPGARAQDGTSVASFTGSIDLMPTLLDWLGAEVPGHLDGRSLMPFLRGQTPGDWRDSIRWEFHFRHEADTEWARKQGLAPRDCMMSVLRDHRFKHVYMPGLPPVLIDLEKDPQELGNVAADPAYAAVERRYLDQQIRNLIHHRDRVMDQFSK
ncbi:sulfatase-like hydrolase/transferase [Mameliella alba]|nr:sulfatase-like hydrolase/transferase [Antarctobacter heliothermus]MBY6146461.1 sulfatase-like hydrolase/transferase [Mameliella alba]MCA0955859.1 sulfatase-like hydrolase/transferase [Mameliella alba]